MGGEKRLDTLLKTMEPTLNAGKYVFCQLPETATIQQSEIVMVFREQEGNTVIIGKEHADQLKLEYTFIAAWITLTVHSSLEAIGLTAAFSNALSKAGISCNVVAAFHHDHIFVDHLKANAALEVLRTLAK